jgi:hypothetical protein
MRLGLFQNAGQQERTMEAAHTHIKVAAAVLDVKEQKVETVQRLVGQILGRAGCPGCGRLAYLQMQFGGDPAPEAGVISIHTSVG